MIFLRPTVIRWANLWRVPREVVSLLKPLAQASLLPQAVTVFEPLGLGCVSPDPALIDEIIDGGQYRRAGHLVRAH